MSAPTSTGPGFGTNSWLVEEMYEQFREDPESVGEAWREFFADYKPISPAPARRRSSGAGTDSRGCRPSRPPRLPPRPATSLE